VTPAANESTESWHLLRVPLTVSFSSASTAWFQLVVVKMVKTMAWWTEVNNVCDNGAFWCIPTFTHGRGVQKVRNLASFSASLKFDLLAFANTAITSVTPNSCRQFTAYYSRLIPAEYPTIANYIQGNARWTPVIIADKQQPTSLQHDTFQQNICRVYTTNEVSTQSVRE